MGIFNNTEHEYNPDIMKLMSAFPFGFRIIKPDGSSEFIVVSAQGLIEAEQRVAEVFIDHDDYEVVQESLVYILEKQYNGLATLTSTVV
jgi:hypothetical protein